MSRTILFDTPVGNSSSSSSSGSSSGSRTIINVEASTSTTTTATNVVVNELLDKNLNKNPFHDADNIDLGLLLKTMHKLPNDKLPPVCDKSGKVVSRKEFYKTYKASSMNDDQRSKCTDFWNQLDKQTQHSVRAVLVHDTLLLKDQTAREATTGGDRSATTTANELVRLLHLLYDVDNVGAIARAIERTKVPLNRVQLDGRKSQSLSTSGVTMSEEVDGWGELASCFNNPEVRYSNKCVMEDMIDGEGVTMCSEDIYAEIYPFVKDLDPCLPEDAVVRDKEWIQKSANKLKGQVSLVYSNFMKSGNQDGRYEDMARDWLKDVQYVSRLYNFASGAQKTVSADVTVYALVLIDQQDIVSTGKTTGDEEGIDEGNPVSTASSGRQIGRAHV
jgi:hypothetical protein